MFYAEIVIVMSLVGLGWLWFDSMKAWETAVQAVRTACASEGLQLLDETIARVLMRPRRDRFGQLRWFRVYQFEYTETGDSRRQGSVHLLGQELTLLNLGSTAMH